MSVPPMKRKLSPKLAGKLQRLLRERGPHADQFFDGVCGGTPWVKDAKGRRWTHSGFGVMLGAIQSTMVHGPASFEYLYRQSPDNRSGWRLMEEWEYGLWSPDIERYMHALAHRPPPNCLGIVQLTDESGIPVLQESPYGTTTAGPEGLELAHHPTKSPSHDGRPSSPVNTTADTKPDA